MTRQGEKDSQLIENVQQRITMQVDLGKFQDSDGFVIHFGGASHEVDTYTFANALVAFSDTVREVNSQINQGHSIVLRLEDVGKGSFRGRIKGEKSGILGKLKWAAEQSVIPILIAFIYDQYIDQDTFEIEVSDELVVIMQGGDRTIIPRSAYDSAKNLPSPERVHSQMERVVDVIERDPKIESFGITKELDDEVPVVNLPRDNWGVVRRRAAGKEDESKLDREKEELATLGILKAVFSAKKRKWDFVWRGMKISANIEDPIFVADIMQRKITIGNGDSIECTLVIRQKWHEDDGVWLNAEYAVKSITKYVEASQNRDFIADNS